MVIATLRQVGGSVMIALPPAFLDHLDLGARSTVSVSLDGERIVIVPRTRPRYTLDELLAQCDDAAPTGPEDAAWTAGSPAGDEIV